MIENQIHVVIEGPVGAGKSTLMQLLVDEGFTAFPEPVVQNSLLEKFYYNRERFSFPLQIYLLNKRLEHLRQAASVEKSVMDRSIYCDQIFAEMLWNNGDLTNEEFQIYQELHSNMLEHCDPPTLMVYLEISTDTAIDRIHKRNRAFELQTERWYWETLNLNYRRYFRTYDKSPLITVNVDEINIDKNPVDKAYVVGLIQDRLTELAVGSAGRMTV